ncbi:hypothetical protein [Botrimarina sp.]|uniref:N-acyl amino acid synthase FeeM domain-containing protein n=1 Tax=Botrimarina sp. TaxID=2795802 RepID=UPI0032ED3EF1
MLAKTAPDVRPDRSLGTAPSQSNAPLPVTVASSRRDVLNALRLVHDSYCDAGLIEPNESGCRVLPQHTLPTTDILVALCRGEVASTLSLVRDSHFGVPLESVFPEFIEQRRLAGVPFAEVSCLADRRSDRHRSGGLLSSLMAFTAQFAVQTGVDELMITVHPRHAKFYQRRLGFEMLCDDVRNYGAVRGNPAVLLMLDLPALQAMASPAHRRLFVEQVFGLHAMQRPPYSDALAAELAWLAGEQSPEWTGRIEPTGLDEEPVILPFEPQRQLAG